MLKFEKTAASRSFPSLVQTADTARLMRCSEHIATIATLNEVLNHSICWLLCRSANIKCRIKFFSGGTRPVRFLIYFAWNNLVSLLTLLFDPFHRRSLWSWSSSTGPHRNPTIITPSIIFVPFGIIRNILTYGSHFDDVTWSSLVQGL